MIGPLPGLTIMKLAFLNRHFLKHVLKVFQMKEKKSLSHMLQRFTQTFNFIRILQEKPDFDQFLQLDSLHSTQNAKNRKKILAIESAFTNIAFGGSAAAPLKKFDYK